MTKWALAACLPFCFAGCGLRSEEVLHERESRYHYIRVTQAGAERTLAFRRAGSDCRESVIDTKDPLRLVLPYTERMFAGFLFVPEPRDILMVGLGGGVCPRVMTHYFPEARCDVIELDPAVLDIAKEYFGFEEGPRIHVTIRDGRVGVKVLGRKGARYDLILLDAFRAGYIPYHLTTREFLEECRQLLRPGGVLVSNLWPSLMLYEYERRTMATVFEEQYAFGRWGNTIVVCLQERRGLTPEDLLARADEITLRRNLRFRLVDVAADLVPNQDYEPGGDILTDDFAPANVLNSIPRE
ncbi:MAG: fused MFS/spermidine synthase [Lentisphaeria bacterium]|nr:fused MFS/spermidine synthase [Lentisphaeria bacterium]